MTTVEAELTNPERERLRLVIRCGRMRTLHVCTTRQGFPRGSKVILKTSRGLESGEVLCDATPEAIRQLQNPPGGQVLRQVTPQDEQELSRIGNRLDQDFETCAQQIRESGLPMDLVDVERLLSGELLVVYFMAENRVDFRQLVKSLATTLQLRIEMKQIGARDESRLLADYGDCGKPVCCNTHLVKMPPVTMRMAKLQKATLDPTKISGRCGRLKCCLRYEFETYDELQKELPAVGSQVVTANGKGRVLSQEILSQQLLVQTEDNRRVLISAGDVLAVTGPARNPNQELESKSHQEQ
jgi:cell fate regulator YaaT (PSP1 superfamily)